MNTSLHARKCSGKSLRFLAHAVISGVVVVEIDHLYVGILYCKRASIGLELH